MNGSLRLSVSALSLRAGGAAQGRRLVQSLDFEVLAGQCWVVLGPNGSGKSSLLAALAGVFPIDAGEVSLQGRPLQAWRLAELADWRAWCPQFWVDPFAATVAETVRLVRDRQAFWPWQERRDDDAEVVEILERLDLAALQDTDVRTLSGGERQRVAIATAMLQGAPLLLLDEPASHLDLAHQQRLIGWLRDAVSAGQGVITSLHDLNLAWDLATHALLLDGRGQVMAGPRDTVLVPSALSAAFGVPIDIVEVCGQRRFWVGPAREGP
jgi:iron complex transport system ATP-binding protein